jgi:hypothetical protein
MRAILAFSALKKLPENSLKQAFWRSSRKKNGPEGPFST